VKQQPASHAEDLKPLLDKESAQAAKTQKEKAAQSSAHVVAALVYGACSCQGCQQRRESS
jgi:hypothetical protein